MKDKTKLFTPTFHVKDDLIVNGHVLAKQGEVINPLTVYPLKESLIFIDGDDDVALHWAVHYQKHSQKPVKLILVKGAVIARMKQHKIRMYFDQRGQLSRVFHLHAVPAIVDQLGQQIRVREVAL